MPPVSARPCQPNASPMRSLLAQRPNLPPQESSENQVEIGGKIRLAYASGRRMRTQHEQATPGKTGEPPAYQFPEPSLHPVANHRRANRTADYKAYLRPGVLGYRTSGKQQVPGQGHAAGPATRAHRDTEFLRAPHPRLPRQHDPSCAAQVTARPASRRRHGERPGEDDPPGRYRATRESDRRSPATAGLRPSQPAGQTASCPRPLRRRAARTARPARVRIRSRKPWTLARRRLFGWNVRLLTGTPDLDASTS